MPIFSPEEAADILAKTVDAYDFILYEYFQTDKVGHKQDMSLAIAEINKLSRFVFRLLTKVDLKNTLIMLTSDHGNIEDISTKSHTRNLAMTFVWGPHNKTISDKLKSITDVAPVILEFLGELTQQEYINWLRLM